MFAVWLNLQAAYDLEKKKRDMGARLSAVESVAFATVSRGTQDQAQRRLAEASAVRTLRNSRERAGRLA